MAFNKKHTLASQFSIDPQDDCPLFNKIPPEIRHIIFSLTLSAYNNGAPYRKGSFYDRPGYHYRHRIDTALLLTCKLVVVEVHHISNKRQGASKNVYLALWNKWLFRGILTGGTGKTGGLCTWIPNNGARRKGHFAETTKISPRDPGAMFSAYFHGLKRFELELETVEGKKAELDEIVARPAGWRFLLGDDNILVLDESKTVYSSWRGVPRFSKNPIRHLNVPGWEDTPESYQTPKLKPQIVEMAEDFLDAQKASLLDEVDAPDTPGPGKSAPVSPQTLAKPNPASGVSDSKGMTSEIAHRIIAEVKNIEGFQPAELARIYGYVQTGLTEAEILLQACRELEDMSALQYSVVTMTWEAQPAFVRSASHHSKLSGARFWEC
ncbi:hypothetical protein MMC11_000979 [Xylographa trunciseda]|nr:hypothetical protein [Xylographa trunciseda]